WHGFTLLPCAAKRFHVRWADAYSNSSTMFRFLKQQRRQRLRAQPFPSAWRSIIFRNLPIFRRLPPEDQIELLGHVQVFLREKHFEGCGGLELTDEIRVTIAAQACLLLLHRETDYYPKLTSILVYPAGYTAYEPRPFAGTVLDAAGPSSRLYRDGAPYPAEFFAGATDACFERARVHRARHPELYAEFARFVRQDPIRYSDEPATARHE